MKLNALSEASNKRLLSIQTTMLDLLPDEWSINIDADQKLSFVNNKLTGEVMIKGSQDLIPLGLYDGMKEASYVEEAEEDFVSTLEEQNLKIRSCSIELDSYEDENENDEDLAIKSVTLIFDQVNDAVRTLAAFLHDSSLNEKALEDLDNTDLHDLCETMKQIVNVDWENLH